MHRPIARTPAFLSLLWASGTLLACGGARTNDPSPGYDESSSSGGGDASKDTEEDSPNDSAGDGDGGRNDTDEDGDTGRPWPRPDCESADECGIAPVQACCQQVALTGGTFLMGVGSGADACPEELTCAPHETPEHEVTISPFSLGVFEVTVGRFRQFVEIFNELSFEAGDGQHPQIAGSGIDASFVTSLPRNETSLRASLVCDTDATFTESIGAHEFSPINCVSWHLAMAFCIFDGGRLPTEAEWEFAAAGGSENRLYPWGNQLPGSSLASFSRNSVSPVGSFPEGQSRDGVRDLAGNVWEWTLDWLDTHWYENEGFTCQDCARLSSGTHRVLRGGAFSYEAEALRSATRSGELPEVHGRSIGFRCAYDH